MNELLILQELLTFLFLAWVIFCLWGLYVNTYRSLIDRMRAGISPPPKNENADKLLNSLLAAPNHESPYHVESAFLSSLQVTFGTLTVYLFLKQNFPNSGINLSFIFISSLLIPFLLERICTRIASYSAMGSSLLPLHLKIGKPLMLTAKILCLPFAFFLKQMERILSSLTKPQVNVKDEKNEFHNRSCAPTKT